ncbi:MAG: hypothetical protein M3040_12110 [Bacteroidota bacterium]|nr:hypothetical protein [Bacteroidota bacterium]
MQATKSYDRTKKSTRFNTFRLLISFVFICIVVLYMVHVSKRPFYNSDMLAYMAIPLQMKGLNQQQIQDSVYGIAQLHVPAKNFTDLTTLNQGRIERYHNYRLFYDYLRFFRLKPLYVLVISTFYKIGVNLVFATILPSLIFTGGLLLAVYFGVKKLFAGAIMPLFIGLVIMLLGFTNELAVLSSPDAMSSFFVFLLFLNIFFQGKEAVSYLLLALSVFTRIDNLTLFPFILYYYRFDKVDMKSIFKGVAVMAVLSIIVLAVPYLFGNRFDWFKDFIFKPSMYVFMVKRSVGLMRTDFNLLFLLISVVVYLNLSHQKHLKKLFTGVIMILATRFLLFPSYEERFYFIFKLMLIFLFVAHFSYQWIRSKSTVWPNPNSLNKKNEVVANSYSV